MANIIKNEMHYTLPKFMQNAFKFVNNLIF